jgi:hypothetical protein
MAVLRIIDSSGGVVVIVKPKEARQRRSETRFGVERVENNFCLLAPWRGVDHSAKEATKQTSHNDMT